MEENKDNVSEHHHNIPEIYNITMEDSNWIMTSAFIIFTMQTGILHKSEKKMLKRNSIKYCKIVFLTVQDLKKYFQLNRPFCVVFHCQIIYVFLIFDLKFTK